MKHVLTALFLIVTIVTQVQAQVPRLVTNGKDIVQVGHGPIQLRGINWSEPDLCTKEDMAIMQNWGVNVVRIWCDDRSIMATYGDLDRGKFDLANVIDWAEEYEIYLILALGDVKIGPTNTLVPWKNKEHLFAIETAIDVLAHHVASENSVFAIEFQNEPPTGWGGNLLDYMDYCNKMISSIREYAPNTTVIVHGPAQLEDLPKMPQALGGNIVYARSFWDPYEFTHTRPAQDWPQPGRGAAWLDARLQILDDFGQRYDVPVILTEFGAMVHAPGPSELEWTKDVIDSVEEKDIHALYWGYKSYRASSFHIYHNRVDRMKPPVFLEWVEMKNVLIPWWSQEEFFKEL